MRNASRWRVSRNGDRKRCSVGLAETHDRFSPGKLIRQRCLHEQVYRLPPKQDHQGGLACAYRGTMKFATSVKEFGAWPYLGSL